MNTVFGGFAFVVTALVLVVDATPAAPLSPQRQTYNSRFLRLEAAPYPAAGYHPQGEQFRLPTEGFPPQRQQQQPDGVYGPPEVATEEVTTETDATTTELPTTTPYIPRRVLVSKNTKKADVKVANKQVNAKQEFTQEGVYYIYHPDGLLQRVVYATTSEDMGYTAKLSYKDVEPIQEPIYTYDPQTLAFSQVQL